MNILKVLSEKADPAYKKFTQKLLPTVDPDRILGVRSPDIKSLAKELAKGDYDFDDKIAIHEYILLEGFYIGYKKENPEDKIKRIEKFLPKIDNWAVCDSFVSALKFTRKNQEPVFKFLDKYFKSENEYELRFAIVMAKTYFVNEKYMGEVFKKFDEIKSNKYYVKMAMAWAISEYYIKYHDQTLKYLKENRLDDFTYNKALQKIRESKRVDDEIREFISTMKR
ncbi:MAG: DNA alkylation repair protein [Finegoldia sp.]|nr:DNA alkylation repair protein [Finegoldia sp.]